MAIFTNQATLSYNGTVTTSNVTTGELLEVLSITKTAASDTYGPQDTVTYVVSITNTGTAAFSNLTVTDNLGGYTFDGGAVYPLTYVPGSALYYINGVLQADPAVVPGAPLVFSGTSDTMPTICIPRSAYSVWSSPRSGISFKQGPQ